MNKSISIAANVYLVKLRGSGYEKICTQDNIIDAVQDCVHGIESIKMYDESKQKFKKVKRETLRMFFEWDTEVMQNKFIKNYLS